MSLADAPPEMKLAVDLIELLELNEVEPAIVLAALAIVRRDYEHKLEQHKTTASRSQSGD